MKTYDYTLYVAVNYHHDSARGAMDRKIVTTLQQPIENLLDDEKSYIKLPEGLLIMKHSIKAIVDDKKANKL